MANKIKIGRGTKARIETIKETLDDYEIVYSMDTKELGIKLSNGNIEYFMNATDIDAIVDNKQDKLVAGDNITINPDTNVISASGGSEYVLTKPKIDAVLEGTIDSIQLGSGASAEGDRSIAVGHDSLAEGNDSTAVGPNAKATIHYTTALGSGASAEGVESAALGSGASATGEGSAALGSYSSAEGEGSVALGHSALASGLQSIAIGAGTEVTEDYVVDFGSNRQVRVNETPVSDRDAVSKKYLSDSVNNVIYEKETHKLTFERYAGVDIVVDLPIEALIENISLDGNNLVLTYEDGTTTSVPLNTLLVGVVKEVNGKTPNSSGVVNLSYNDLNNLPNLFSGNYNDLTNKPELYNKSEVDQKDNQLSNRIDGKQDKLTAGNNITINPTTNVISASGGGGDSYIIININYADLVTLRDSSSLKKGAFYRITDYETTTVQVETQSAGHLFDIIVQALDEKTISENASAINSARDTTGYFDGMRLEAWKLKYTLDNDRLKYYWADPTNGKGVIYRMVDEYENDLPYDFKNIQFKRYMLEEYPINTRLEGRYFSFKDFESAFYPSNSVIDDGDFIWAYTFTTEIPDDESYVESTTLNKYIFTHDDDGNPYCAKNIFGDKIAYIYDNLLGEFSSYILGNNVIYSVIDPIDEENPMYVYDLPKYNTIGNDFYNNTIGNSFESNYIGNGFKYNTVGNSFGYNTVGNSFGYNAIGNSSNYNTIGNNFSSNNVGGSFGSNTVGNNFVSNDVGAYFQYNTVGNTVMYIHFSLASSSSSRSRYLHLKDGLSGISSNNKLDLYYLGLYHREYPTTFEIIADGSIVSSWERLPLVRDGKAKSTKTSISWGDI